MKTWDWLLKWGGGLLVGQLMGQLLHYVDSVSIEVNGRTPSWWAEDGLLVWGSLDRHTDAHTHTHDTRAHTQKLGPETQKNH